MSPRKLRQLWMLGIAVALGASLLWWFVSNRHTRSLDATANHPPIIQASNGIASVSAPKGGSSVWERRMVARGAADDLGSISETFKESGNCLEYFVARNEIASLRSDARVEDLSRETEATLDNLDASLTWASSVLKQTKEFCAGANEEAVARAYMTSLLKASLMGDADAQSCFVLSGAQIPSPHVMRSGKYNKYLENQYLKNAPVFTQRALERNDPLVAVKAVRRYIASPEVHSSRLDELPLPDPYLTWRAARLASLRALPEQRPSIEANLAAFEKLDLISPEQVKNGNDWARATYEQQFAREGRLNVERFSSCNSLK